MNRGLIPALLIAVYALHQDLWFWSDRLPLLFGFLPPGLWYHALYTIGASVLMAVLVRSVWSSLDEDGLH